MEVMVSASRPCTCRALACRPLTRTCSGNRRSPPSQASPSASISTSSTSAPASHRSSATPSPPSRTSCSSVSGGRGGAEMEEEGRGRLILSFSYLSIPLNLSLLYSSRCSGVVCCSPLDTGSCFCYRRRLELRQFVRGVLWRQRPRGAPGHLKLWTPALLDSCVFGP